MKAIESFLKFQLIHFGDYILTVFNALNVVAIFLITALLLWLIKKAMFRKRYLIQRDVANIYAVYQIIKYIAWIVAIGLMLESVGIRLTLLLAGSAALLVGVGLGLQKTFNDFVSGIILLTERSIRLGDILEIDGDVIKIQKIGLRTSEGLNRDDISVIIPNSLITANKVINWSHQGNRTRFKIDVGVAYDSNIELVEKVLEESAAEHPDIYGRELVEARLVRFNDSSLDFQVLFFSEQVFRIERIKSDIRMIIHRKFRENGIQIPFPQLDVRMRPSGNGNASNQQSQAAQ